MESQLPVNTLAPISNVGLCINSLMLVINREKHLPGMSVFYGPSGFGKSHAAAYSSNRLDTYYIECKSVWNKTSILDAILKEMGITPAKTMSYKLDQICEQLVRSQRALIIDEMDHIVHKKAVEIIRDIYDGSQAPILLIGEEGLPDKLKKWERFDGRILGFTPAEPASPKDTKELQKLYCDGIDIGDDLLQKIHELANGSVRRICVNLSRIREFAQTEGLLNVDLGTWGEKELYTGRAPRRRRVA